MSVVEDHDATNSRGAEEAQMAQDRDRHVLSLIAHATVMLTEASALCEHPEVQQIIETATATLARSEGAMHRLSASDGPYRLLGGKRSQPPMKP